MQAPWYSYPHDNAFGEYPDPVGNYAKPDANFYGIPNNTPITALASGIVTSVRRQPWGAAAYSITVHMDNAWNSVARYSAYNYVNNPVVFPGQHIQAGQTLAFSGNIYNIGTAFAFTDSPIYGTGSANEPFSGSYINPALSPVNFLNSINGGSFVNQGGGDSLTQFLNNNNLNLSTGGTTPGDNSFAGFDWTRFIDAGLLFVIGIVLLAVGGLLLMDKMGLTGVAEKAVIA